jgi:hypothetical protein
MIELNIYVLDFINEIDEFYYNIKRAYQKSIRTILASQMTNETKLAYFNKLNKAIERLEAI